MLFIYSSLPPIFTFPNYLIPKFSLPHLDHLVLSQCHAAEGLQVEALCQHKLMKLLHLVFGHRYQQSTTGLGVGQDAALIVAELAYFSAIAVPVALGAAGHALLGNVVVEESRSGAPGRS